MMYSKLAFRNIRRSLRDYIIYFVTLTLTAALMYSFLALGFSPDILAMTENMSMLTSGILMLSVLVALLSSFVVGYAIRFMLGQRKKEFAAYELMGMEVKTVRNLFLVENSIIGGAAFLLGSLLGTAMSGLLNQVVQNIFEIPHRYQVLFSLRALGMTLFFFILMYGFGMLRAAKVIRRRKVIDLLYDNQKNEEAGFQPLHRSVLTCLLSLAAMVAGVILLEKGLHIQTNEAMLYWGGACLLILAGVYELHRKIPMLLYQLAKRNPHRKYREETLFFLGQIGRRIQSSGRTMAVVAILLTVSLATMFVGMTMGAGYKANMEAYYPYDAGVAIDAPLTKDSMDSVRSCSVLAFEQLSAIDRNWKNYAVIDRLGVSGRRQASLVRKELSTVFLIPLFFPIVLTVLLIVGTQFFFGEAILQEGLVLFYGLVTILLFCAIYLTYFGATMSLFKRVILRPEMH